MSFPFRRGSTFPDKPISEDQAILENIEQILQVSRTERVYRPDVGSALNVLLFEQNTPAIQALIREEIRRSIRSQEKRVQLIDVRVTSTGSKVEAQIVYSRLGTIRTANVSLQRP